MWLCWFYFVWEQVLYKKTLKVAKYLLKRGKKQTKTTTWWSSVLRLEPWSDKCRVNGVWCQGLPMCVTAGPGAPGAPPAPWAEPKELFVWAWPKPLLRGFSPGDGIDVGAEKGRSGDLLRCPPREQQPQQRRPQGSEGWNGHRAFCWDWPGGNCPTPPVPLLLSPSSCPLVAVLWCLYLLLKSRANAATWLGVDTEQRDSIWLGFATALVCRVLVLFWK